MITSFEVGAIFRIINEASPELTKILRQVRALTAAIDKAKASLADLGKGAISPASLGAATKETEALATAWKGVATEARSARAAISSASAAARVPIPSPAGVGGGGGRHRPGWLGGRAHFSSPGIGLPGGAHMHLRGGMSGGAAAAAGILGYGAYQDAEMEDAVWQLAYHAGLPQNAASHDRFRKVVQDAMAQSGYGLRDIVEAAKQEVRMFQGTPGGGLDVLPEMLRASTIESRLKDETPEESMKALIGLAHMAKQYTPDQIKQLAPAFAFLSTANPGSLGSIEKAAGYAVPILQSGLGIDPMQTLLLGTALTRAGATSTKSGTWLREMAIRAMPGAGGLMSGTAYRKHEDALKAFGLVDENERPTWFTDGKPDIFKMLDIAGSRANSISLDKRAAYERALFGAQGGGGFALLADPAVREQIQSLQSTMNSPEFKNRYASFSDAYREGSPVQQTRAAIADFNVAMMDLGRNVLPAVTGSLKDFDAAIKYIRSLIPGADKDGSTSDKWRVGTRALEGMALGAGLGTIIPGVGTVAGGLAGGAAGGLVGVVEGLVKSSAEAAPPVDRFGREVINTGNAASSSVGAMKALGDAIRGLGGAPPGGVFPGGASRMNYLGGPPRTPQAQKATFAFHVDGRIIAQAVVDHLGPMYEHPTSAPAADGVSTYFGGDHQYTNT